MKTMLCAAAAIGAQFADRNSTVINVTGDGSFMMNAQELATLRRYRLPVTVVVNAAMALPFALRAIGPAVRREERAHGRLASSLGLTGVARLRIVLLPRVRAPLGFAAGLAAALSMGDLGVIALFATEDRATLPLVMYQLMGSFRMEAAAGAALLLVALAFGLFWAFDRGGRG